MNMKKSLQSTEHSLQNTARTTRSAVNCTPSTANSSPGFTLLLATLIASIVVALGISIFRLSQKEITLSSIGRESQFAFYAADSSSECALYWDVQHGYFGSTTPSTQPTC